MKILIKKLCITGIIIYIMEWGKSVTYIIPNQCDDIFSLYPKFSIISFHNDIGFVILYFYFITSETTF